MPELESKNVLFLLVQMVFHILRAFCAKQHLPSDKRIKTVCETGHSMFIKDETQKKRLK